MQPPPQIQPPNVSGYANTPYSRSSHSWYDGCLPEGYPDLFSSAHISLPVSNPNTIHHSHLNVCLIDYLDRNPCLLIVFWLNWFLRLRFCGRCRNLKFRITITTPKLPNDGFIQKLKNNKLIHHNFNYL